jgi:uncharacterized membrane protein
VFILPELLGRSGGGYAEWFGSLMLACGATATAAVAVALSVTHTPRAHLVAAVAVAFAAPFLLSALITHHYDLLPAMFTAVGLAAAATGRLRLGAVVLALGALAKVYPAVALPVLVIAAWRRRGTREAVWTAGVAAITGLVVLLPFLVVGGAGVIAALERFVNRPLQVESLGGSLLLALRGVLGEGVSVETSFGSQNVVGPQSTVVGLVLLAVQLVAVLGLYRWFAVGPPTARRLLRAAAGVILAYVAFGKVLSPQYLLWLLPLVLVVTGPRGWAAATGVVVAAWITTLYFPERYFELPAYDPNVAWVVVARDLALVAAVLALVVPRRWAAPLLGPARARGARHARHDRRPGRGREAPPAVEPA